MRRTGTTRRHVLTVTGVIAAGVLTGCSGDSPDRDGPAPDADRASADAALGRRLATAGVALRERYDATLERHPALADRLAPLRAFAAEHIEALGGPGRPAAGATGSPAPALRISDSETAALTALARAELRTAEGRTDALETAGPELARLLASMAAAGAAHAHLLRDGDSA